MCQQIMRVLKAERTRDHALAALEEMNRNLERRVRERTEQLEMPIGTSKPFQTPSRMTYASRCK